jgi:hypothetical protein
MRDGIRYYRNLPGLHSTSNEAFIKGLDDAETELDQLNYQYVII